MRCANCSTTITLTRPGPHGPEWEHDETGAVECWGFPPPPLANDVAEPEDVNA